MDPIALGYLDHEKGGGELGRSVQGGVPTPLRQKDP